MSPRRAVAALVLALAAGAAAAQAPASPAKRQLVERLVALQQPGIQNVASQVAFQNAQRVLQAAVRQLPRVPEAQREATGKAIEAEVRRTFEEVNPMLRESATRLASAVLVPLYDERYTEDELRQLLAWLESPLAKKYGSIESDAGRTLAERLIAENRATLEPKFRALDESVARRLGLPPVPASAPRN